NGLLHLRVLSGDEMVGRQFNRNAGRHAFALDQPSLPRKIRGDRQSQDIARSGLKRRATQQASSRFCPNDSGQSILLCKCGYHLAGAGGVLVDKNHHATVKSLWTKPLSDYENRFVNEAISQGQPEKSSLVRRNVAKPWQLLPCIALLFARTSEAVSDLLFSGSQIAHQPQPTDAPSSVSTKVHDQASRIFEMSDSCVKHFGKINTNRSRKHGHLEPTDPIGKLGAQNCFGYDHRMALRPWRRDNQAAYDPFAIRFVDCILRVFAYRENRWFGRHQFFISDLKKNVAWTQACGMSWAAFVNVLEHPTLFPIKAATHESCGDSVAARDLRTL